MPFVEDRLGTPKSNEHRYPEPAVYREEIQAQEIAALKERIQILEARQNGMGTHMPDNWQTIVRLKNTLNTAERRIKELEADNAILHNLIHKEYRALIDKYKASLEDIEYRTRHNRRLSTVNKIASEVLKED